jgi:hypothetical protein
MDDPLNVVERLAVRARELAPESMPLADGVMRRLRRPERNPLAWFTAAAVAAMILLVVLSGVSGDGGDALDVVFQATNLIQMEGGF